MTVRERDDLVLPGGRRLALCEVGDPDGVVAFYFQCTGSSRLETALYADAAAAQGVRLVGWWSHARTARSAGRARTGSAPGARRPSRVAPCSTS